MSETEKSKPKESPSTSTTTTTTTTAAVSSSSSAVTAASKVSSSNGSTTIKSSSSSSTAVASSSVSSSTGSSSSSTTTKHQSKPPPPLPPPTPPALKHLPPPAHVGRPRANYSTPSAIRKAFLNFMKDPECLDKAANYLYESLLEDAVMGIYLEVHHSFKSGSMEAIEGQSEDDASFKIVDTPNYDVFGMSKPRKAMDCNCPNCDRMVAALRFAPHLESCMGMGRKKTSRTASRRLANAKEGNASYFSSNVSDDEDDADWSSEKRRKKIQSSRTNGSKKNGKSS